MLDVGQLCSSFDGVLHRFALYGKDGHYSCDENLLQDIQSITHAVSAAAAQQSVDRPLPVKVLEELRILGSTCWNMTVRHGCQDGAEGKRLKASLRELATVTFLLGNHAYSAEDVQHAYFTHHPREAEQCILMCLKASRDLSLSCASSAVLEMVALGEKVASHITVEVKQCLSHLKNHNLVWEFEFTRMEVLWNLRNVLEASHSCEKIAQMLMRDSTLRRDLRESYFYFIFTASNDAVQPCEESAVRAMLMCSVNVQKHLKGVGVIDSFHHLSTLRGVTLQQIALSWLREGNALEAAPWAEEADEMLHSHTSALLRLRATAGAGAEQAAALQLRDYVQRQDVTVDDAISACFELHNLFKTEQESSIECMGLLQSKVKDRTTGEAVIFRLVQLLLHNGSTQSYQSALQMLQNECVNFEDPKYRRHCFMWLWELSEKVELGHNEVIGSLEAAVVFADSASDFEFSAVRLRLCTEYVKRCEQEHHTAALTQAKNILLKYTENNPHCVFAHSLLFNISVLEKDESAMDNEIRCLGTCEPADLVVPALCTAVNYSLGHNSLHGASQAAKLAILCSGCFGDDRTELEVLRVYAATIISKSIVFSDADVRMVAERVANLISGKLASLNLTHGDVTWWAQALLLLGSEFADGPNITSVLLFRLAARIAVHDPAVGGAGFPPVLKAGVLCALEDEFHLFSLGRPQLDIPDLEQLIQICHDFISVTCDTESRTTFLLAQMEHNLRSPSHDMLSAVDTLAEQLKEIPAPYEALEALAEGTAFEASRTTAEPSQLRGVASQLFMMASVVMMESMASSTDARADGHEAAVSTITKALSYLYKSFGLAPNKKEQLQVARQVTGLLSHTLGDASVASLLKCWGSDAAAATAVGLETFALLFTEYFTIEAWNSSVFHLHIGDKEAQDEWAQVAWVLADTLPQSHRVASALRALKEITAR